MFPFTEEESTNWYASFYRYEDTEKSRAVIEAGNFDPRINALRFIPNPNYVSVQQGLTKVCLHIIQTADESQQFFASGVLKNIEVDLGQDGYELLGRTLSSTTNPLLQEEILEMIQARSNDLQMAKVLAEAKAKLAGSLQKKVQQVGQRLFTGFLKQREPIEDLTFISRVLDMSTDDLQRMIIFIHDAHLEHSYTSDAYNHTNILEKYRLLSLRDGMPEFIIALQELGYFFDIDHAEGLLRSLPSKDVILYHIKAEKTKSGTDNFNFRPVPIQKENTTNGVTETSYLFDPYEIKIISDDVSHFKEFMTFLFQQPVEEQRKYADAYLRIMLARYGTIYETYDFPESHYEQYFTALQHWNEVSIKPELVQYESYYFGDFIGGALARHPNSYQTLFSLPETAPLLMQENFRYFTQFVLARGGIKNKEDIRVFESFARELGDSALYFATFYFDLQQDTTLSITMTEFIDLAKAFSQNVTSFSFERVRACLEMRTSEFGQILTAKITNSAQLIQILLDYSYFNEREATNKQNYIQRTISTATNSEEIIDTFQFLRWLSDEQITDQDTLTTLREKYTRSLDHIREGFISLLGSVINVRMNYFSDDRDNLARTLSSVCNRFNIPTRTIKVDSIELTLPQEFIHQFNLARRNDPKIQLIPELTVYIVNKIANKGTAFALEEVLFNQVTLTNDPMGRRQGIEANTFLKTIEANIEASVRTWQTAINLQREEPNTPLFIIANERTGPADLAAEYLSEEFARRHRVNQRVNYDRLFDWLRQNQTYIDELYAALLKGEHVKDRVPQEVIEVLGIDYYTILPIYRLKIPSSLNGATDEPQGTDIVLSFLKLASVLGGKTLFMDESTRSAARSIECLYNIVGRRQKQLGGAQVRLVGKIKSATGQNGTRFLDVNPDNTHMKLILLDPWESLEKPINDDSLGFVPEVSGTGIVEIIRPSFTAVSPYGFGTLQDFWKQLIALRVVERLSQS